MSIAKTLSLVLCAATALLAADATGSWKLNTAKSKYTGVPMPKEMVATYTPQGSGWKYSGRGVAATGEPINSSFTYVKDGEVIKATGFPYWDALSFKNGNAAKTTGTLMRGGKPVGNVTRTISADGKTMTISGDITLADGKKGTYLAHYDKQ